MQQTIKVNRSINLKETCTLVIAQQGTGSTSVVKLAIYMSGSTCREFKHPSLRQSVKEDYVSELKSFF
jgi:hypothetical protein